MNYLSQKNDHLPYPNDILRDYWLLRKQANKSYSIRGLALKIGVNHSHLSRVFLGKKI